MILRSVVILTALSVFSVGCGDDDGGELSTGLPPESELGSLEDGDLQKVCEATESYVQQFLTPTRICTIIAAAFADDPQSCEQIKTQCLQEPPMPDEPDDPDEPTCAEDLSEKLKDCEATIEELETCQNDAINAARSTFNITCADAPLPMPAEGEEDGGIDKPASCVALEEKCPGLADEDEFEDQSSFLRSL